jgi:uncharacterized membrane protein YqjE
MSEPGDSSPDSQPRMTGGIRPLLHHAAGLLQARVSLALIELGEARDAFITVFVLAIAALVMASLALIALSALIIILLWESMGAWVIAMLAVGYAVLGGLLLRSAIQMIRDGRLGLPHTMAELRQDREALFPGDAP